MSPRVRLFLVILGLFVTFAGVVLPTYLPRIPGGNGPQTLTYGPDLVRLAPTQSGGDQQAGSSAYDYYSIFIPSDTQITFVIQDANNATSRASVTGVFLYNSSQFQKTPAAFCESCEVTADLQVLDSDNATYFVSTGDTYHFAFLGSFSSTGSLVPTFRIYSETRQYLPYTNDVVISIGVILIAVAVVSGIRSRRANRRSTDIFY